MNLKSIFGFVFGVVVGVILTTTIVVNAGNLAGPVENPDGTESYTLADIYHSLNSGQAAVKSTFSEPVNGPSVPVMFSLYEIYELTRERAPVRKTGQNFYYRYEADGYIQAGVAWPVPRFTDNDDGTVTDNLTGLIWLKNAACYEAKDWLNTTLAVNSLESGECELDDSSEAGDWRIPNLLEMQSLFHYEFYDPIIPNTVGTGKWQEGDPFENLKSDIYWTNTFYRPLTNHVYGINLYDGAITKYDFSFTPPFYFLPVRGGQ